MNLTFSFVLESEPAELKAIPEKFVLLKQILDYRIGMGKEMILTEKSFSGSGVEQVSPLSEAMKKALVQLKKIGTLKTFLERGQKQDFFTLLPKFIECLRDISSKNYNPALEIYYSISLMFLAYINRQNLTEKVSFKIGLHQLVRIDAHVNWKDAVSGTNLTDYIAEMRIQKAKELLESSNMKVYEIAQTVGFESYHYFTRFFKMTTHMTPQEYREVFLRSKEKLQK